MDWQGQLLAPYMIVLTRFAAYVCLPFIVRRVLCMLCMKTRQLFSFFFFVFFAQRAQMEICSPAQCEVELLSWISDVRAHCPFDLEWKRQINRLRLFTQRGRDDWKTRQLSSVASWMRNRCRKIKANVSSLRKWRMQRHPVRFPFRPGSFPAHTEQIGFEVCR